MRFFTSDTHFGHKHVIDFCKRPFDNVQVMNAEIIRRWNITVKPEDTVYHMGDVSFLGMQDTEKVLRQLNGFKILVRGNHDHRPSKMLKLGFDLVLESAGMVLTHAVQHEKTKYHRVQLSHYPYYGQYQDTHRDGSPRDFKERQLVDNGQFLLHGHVHEFWKMKDRMINVGVDQWDFTPVSELEIVELIEIAQGLGANIVKEVKNARIIVPGNVGTSSVV